MKINHILKYTSLQIIIWSIIFVFTNPILQGQEIASSYPTYTNLPIEGGTVRVTVNVKNTPEGFVLKLAAGGLIQCNSANILGYKLVGNVIEIRVGPNTCHFVGVNEQILFYTNAGIVRLDIRQPVARNYSGFIRNSVAGSNAVFMNPAQMVTVVEENYMIPPEASSYQYFWEMKYLNEQTWRRINGATNPSLVTIPMGSDDIVMVRRVAVTNAGVLYSNIVHYIPMHSGILHDIRLRQNSDKILPGKAINIYPDISLGEMPRISYRWLMRVSNNDPWTIIEGSNKEYLQLSGVNRNIAIRREATIGSITISSEVFYFTYVDMSQIKIKADKDRVSHFMPFTLRLEQEIGTGATFEWQKRKKNTTTWTRVIGETTSELKNYNEIREDTYFRLVTTLEGGTYYSNEVLIRYDNIGGGRIGCSSPIIKNGNEAYIHSELPTGTNLGNHYTWEARKKGGNWTAVSGATESILRVAGLTDNTYFRRKIVINSQEYYSNEVLVVISSVPCMMTRYYLDSTAKTVPARTVTDISYFDGAGRDVQHVMVNGTFTEDGDIITPVYQGFYNDKEREYLPYSKINNDGALAAASFEASNWNYLGTDEQAYAFSKVVYDGSPLERQKKITGAGKNWHVQDKGVRITYGTTGEREVRLYRVESNGTLKQDGFYATGSLHKVTTIDEDGNMTETFSDREGKNLLSVNVDGNNRLETYYVYDMYGLLRYVLSPEASARIGATATKTTPVIQGYAYYYEYDEYRRMALKQLPGCDPVYMVCDMRDRLVMAQDGKQRTENANKWSYSLYDEKNRVIEIGEVVSTITSHVALQKEASKSNNYIPSGTRTPIQYTLYDTYVATTNVPIHSFVSLPGNYSTTYSSKVTGLETSIRTRVLDITPVKWLTKTTYYDERGRILQTISDNLQGKTSRVDMKYDFMDNVIKRQESHSISANQTDIVETENSYDTRGRLLNSTTRLNNGAPATISYSYDGVGRLISKTLGNITETRTYNSRGWLTSKNSTPFKMKLRYEAPENNDTACWNGNISEGEWQQGTSAALMYGFTYDGVNRLTETIQKQKSGTTWGLLSSNYLEKGITYDRNGNIETLQRTANGSNVDDLIYTYTGNQLTSLTENVKNSLPGDIYSRGDATVGTYTYDKNGNMTNDRRRGLSFTYNFLNLLREVKTGSTIKAKYIYLAEGTKLRVRDNGDVNGFDYLGSLTYIKSNTGLQLESVNFGDGVIRANVSNSAGSEVNYFLTDHLGSVRVIVDDNGAVKERNDYYPFGARHIKNNYPQLANSKYKYNGKEEQTTGNLKYLDYGARMYDSGLGRWFVGDPLQENYFFLSAYSYCAGNPLAYVDVDGLWIHDYQLMPDGTIIFLKETNDNYDVLYASNSNEEGDINKKKSEKIYDRSILPSLSKGPNSYGSSLAMTTSFIDATNLFIFTSKYSTVEWALTGFASKFYKNGQMSFIIRTSHDATGIRLPNQQYRLADIKFEIHSHPDDLEFSRIASGDPNIPRSGDRWRAHDVIESSKMENKQETPRFYFYHVTSETIYKYTPTNLGIQIKRVEAGQGLREILTNKQNRKK